LARGAREGEKEA